MLFSFYHSLNVENSYVHSGMEYIIQIGTPLVDRLDKNIDSIVTRASTVGYEFVAKCNKRKDDVITKAKGYSSAISEQVFQISQTNVREKVEESVRQAPEIVRSISNKAVSLTKQGLEISIGQENTASVFNTVKTHTPKFVSSLLSEPPTEVSAPPNEASESTVVAAH